MMSNDEIRQIYHPGKTLSQTLDAYGMTQRELAARTDMSPKQINEIIKGKSNLSSDMAVRLEYVFNVSATFWNNLQSRYDSLIIKHALLNKRAREIRLTREFKCYPELVRFGYVKPANTAEDKLNNLLKFFGVTSLANIKLRSTAAFRKANVQSSAHSVAAWLRIGEMSASRSDLPEFNKTVLRNNLDALRALTLSTDAEEVSRRIEELCNQAGVAIVFTPLFKQTGINGAVRWVGGNPVIQLSLRTRTRDSMWFTFFHELGHILYHNKTDEFIEYTDGSKASTEESEADAFAQEKLIPSTAYRSFLAQGDLDLDGIVRFAKAIGVGADIVAGRLAHEGHIDWWLRNKLVQQVSLVRID